MKQSSYFHTRQRIIFGPGAMSELTAGIPGKSRILLVHGRSVLESGKLDELRKLLGQHHLVEFCGVPPEPPLSSVDELAAAGRNERVTAVVAVGGGSVIDAAKAAAMLIPKEGTCTDYFHGRRKVEARGLYFAALPTTSGTGAELTSNSVLTETDTKIKKSIRSPLMVPDLAIVDPLLTLNAPPRLTAASGLDAFTQAVESYTSADANIATKALALRAVSTIFGSLQKACEDGSDIEARTEMARGSLLSAMAFSQSGLGAVHGIAHPAGALLGIPHGVICAILLVTVLEWNMPSSRNEYDELARACGLSDAHAFINAIRRLSSSLQIPSGLSSFGLKKGHFKFIIANSRSRSMECNPRKMSDEDISFLLGKLLS